MKLPLSDILVDPTVNIRVGLDQDTVARYVTILEQLPPVHVFDEVAHILADGFHRYAAARARGWDEIEVIVHRGGRTDAERYSIESNSATGVPLNRAERNRAVQWYLDHDRNLSQTEIAKRTGVAQHTVSNIASARRVRAELPPDIAKAPGLTDTHLYRIATLPEEQRESVARQVVEENLSEPVTRDLVQATLKDAMDEWRKENAWRALIGALGHVEALYRFAPEDLVRDTPADDWEQTQRRLGRAAAHLSTMEEALAQRGLRRVQ